jgi:pimeloyl-ACP methyl ester carboxylesterase
VWGERDRLLPVSDARRAVRHMADAVLTILPGTGHSPNWEQPTAVIEAIDHLHARRAHALPDGRAG